MSTKIALVLGGTSGLGAELVRECIKHDVVPIVVGRTAKSMAMPNELSISQDLSDHSAAEVLMAQLEQRRLLSRIDYIFVVAGFVQQQRFDTIAPNDLRRLNQVLLLTPMLFLNLFQASQQRSYSLTTISSTASYTRRPDEAAYGAMHAARAQLARDLGAGNPRDYPGSKVLLAHCGGMRTDFWKELDVDTSKFMDPAKVAGLILNEVLQPASPFSEVHIKRDPDGNAVLSRGQMAPN